ncbi:MAG: LVIVD repeat-containing protein [Labilibaculum antarcticum]
MKTIKNLAFLSILISLCAGTWSCEDEIRHEYTINEPVYLPTDEFKNAVKTESAKEMLVTGKIYFYNDLILINEKFEGIHVIDNSDPTKPINSKFISIPGNIDMAVKDGILYADSYTDLIAINISDINTIAIEKRFADIFPFSLPPTDNNYPYGQIDPEKGVVVGWEVKRISEKYEEPKYYPYYYDVMFDSANSTGVKASAGGTGKAGSMAKFMINTNTLYTLDSNSSLKLFDISNPDQISKNGQLNVGWGMETLFVYESNLFIGARDGMYIFDITNPFAPQLVSQYSHFMSCDPVVVHNNLAYITLRAGNFCGQNTSQLDVVDLSDITTPTLLKSYGMDNPYGLGIDDELLFVCDGTAGLKIYDASDPLNLGSNLLKVYSDMTPYDVIPLASVLVVIGTEGLFQYDYSDINNIQLLSFITIAARVD